MIVRSAYPSAARSRGGIILPGRKVSTGATVAPPAGPHGHFDTYKNSVLGSYSLRATDGSKDDAQLWNVNNNWSYNAGLEMATHTWTTGQSVSLNSANQIIIDLTTNARIIGNDANRGSDQRYTDEIFCAQWEFYYAPEWALNSNHGSMQTHKVVRFDDKNSLFQMMEGSVTCTGNNIVTSTGLDFTKYFRTTNDKIQIDGQNLGITGWTADEMTLDTNGPVVSNETNPLYLINGNKNDQFLEVQSRYNKTANDAVAVTTLKSYLVDPLPDSFSDPLRYIDGGVEDRQPGGDTAFDNSRSDYGASDHLASTSHPFLMLPGKVVRVTLTMALATGRVMLEMSDEDNDPVIVIAHPTNSALGYETPRVTDANIIDIMRFELNSSAGGTAATDLLVGARNVLIHNAAIPHGGRPVAA